MMMNIPLYMTHSLTKIPHFTLPNGFSITPYQAGDDQNWAMINTKTGEFSSEREALNRFNEEFSPYPKDVKERMLFIRTDKGETIGTTTAWYGDWKNDVIGRLHWVEIIPEFQGKKLAKPLVTSALYELEKRHQKAYLKTQTTSLAAINMYIQIGFLPSITSVEEKKGWELVSEELSLDLMLDQDH